MAWLRTERLIHDVEKGSNLDLLLRGANGIGNRLVDSLLGIGAGLQAIALALSTPQDNSTEVQAQIDKATEQLKLSTNALDAAVKANQPK